MPHSAQHLSGSDAAADARGGGALADEALGGDAACWLPSLCADCGAMIEGPPGTACWRCGGTRREGD